MSNWEKRFTEKVEALRERAVKSFECFVDETVQPVFAATSEFAGRLDFTAATPQRQKGLRSFKFALSENAYVLCAFRAKGMADVEFEYEGFVHKRGHIQPVRVSTSLMHANRDWVQNAFQTALDFLVDEYANNAKREVPEPVLA